MKKTLATAAFFTLIFALSYKTIEDIDLGWHIRAGQFIAQNKTVPQKDLFTFSQSGYPYVYHSWGSELLLFEAYKVAGLPGDSFLYAFALTATIYFLWQTSKIKNLQTSLVYFLFASMATYAAAGNRTRIFSLLCLSLIYYFFENYQKTESKIIWGVPLVMILWTNLHGSFPFGIGFLVLITFLYSYFGKSKLKEKAKTLFLVIAASAAATLINPYSVRAWQNALVVFANSSTKIVAVNPDWQSLLSTSSGWILASLAAFIIFPAFFLRKKMDHIQVFLALIFFILSLISARFLIALTAISIPLGNNIVLEFKKKLPGKIFSSLPVRSSLIAAILVILLTAIVNILQAKIAYTSFESYSKFLQVKAVSQGYPAFSQEADNFLENLKDKKVLNEGNWGGLMLLKNPDRKIFYYSAMDNFFVSGKPFAFEYLNLTNATGNWENQLEKYGIDAVYLPPQYPLVKKLENNPNWQTVFTNRFAQILVKKT